MWSKGWNVLLLLSVVPGENIQYAYQIGLTHLLSVSERAGPTMGQSGMVNLVYLSTCGGFTVLTS